MLKIPLNSAILSKHKSIADSVNAKYKSKYDRENFRHTECMFLTQNEGRLIYTTCPGARALKNWEEVDFILPYPLAINLSSVPYSLSESYSWLEIPDCTMESIKTFYDSSRPKYIKDSDLHTKVVAINNRRANVEFIDPKRFDQNFDVCFKMVKENPLTDISKFEWFKRNSEDKIDYYDIDKIYRLVFGQHNAFDYEMSEQQILRSINQLHAKASTHGIVERSTHDGVEMKTYHFPFAIFEDANQKLMWQGFAQRVK